MINTFFRVALYLGCIVPLGLQGTLVQYMELQAPNSTQKIYLYFDVHLPLKTLNEKQLQTVLQIAKKLPQAKIIAECCQLFIKSSQQQTAKKGAGTYILPPRKNLKFPLKTREHIREHFENFNRAPGDLSNHFLSMLANQDSKAVTVEFADDNRFTINRGINYLWTMGWLIPMAQLLDLDTSNLEEDMSMCNPDTSSLDKLLQDIAKSLKLFAQQLKTLQKTDAKNADLGKKVQQVDKIVSDFDAIATQVRKFAGKGTTLGQFRTKVQQHAEKLVQKHGPTKEVANALLKDVLGNTFDEFFHPAVAAYIYEAHNALDTALLESILTDHASNPIIAYVGGAHGRVLAAELERRHYKVLVKSGVLIRRKGIVEEYENFDQYIASIGRPIFYDAADIKLIGQELMGPVQEELLAPLQSTQDMPKTTKKQPAIKCAA